MGRPNFGLNEKCLNHNGAMVGLVAIESQFYLQLYIRGEGSPRTPILSYVITEQPLTTTKSTCGCKYDKDERDTEKNPV